jgi:hypothetical protein
MRRARETAWAALGTAPVAGFHPDGLPLRAPVGTVVVDNDPATGDTAELIRHRAEPSIRYVREDHRADSARVPTCPSTGSCCVHWGIRSGDRGRYGCEGRRRFRHVRRTGGVEVIA